MSKQSTEEIVRANLKKLGTKYLKHLSKNLPVSFLALLDKTYHTGDLKVTQLLLDWPTGVRMGIGASKLTFMEGKEIQEVPSEVYISSTLKMNQEQHLKNLTNYYKNEGEDGVIKYLAIALNPILITSFHSIENENGLVFSKKSA